MKSPEGGRLLDRVAYCMRPKCKATNIVDEKIEVRDTFPYNPESKTAPETAKRWARGYGWRSNDKHEPEVIVRDNEPFAITITDLHVRSEGGRAYKVIDDNNRRFDLREDQVLEVMKRVGILPMGIVSGTFVWGVLGSQVRLVLVDGELHQSMLRGANDKKAFELAQKAGLTPTESTLQVGHIYRKKDKTLHLFLGRVKRPRCAKVQFAFVEMPPSNKEADQTDEDIDDLEYASDTWKAGRKRYMEVCRNWDKMTWLERCNFYWNEEPNLYYVSKEGDRYSNPPIIFMASPKFEADVGEVSDDFVAEIRTNEHNRHNYRTAQQWTDLAEEWKLGPGCRRPYYHSDDWRLSLEERDRRRREWDKKQHEDIRQTAREYRDALEWQ